VRKDQLQQLNTRVLLASTAPRDPQNLSLARLERGAQHLIWRNQIASVQLATTVIRALAIPMVQIALLATSALKVLTAQSRAQQALTSHP
jgi:hypothetical protein